MRGIRRFWACRPRSSSEIRAEFRLDDPFFQQFLHWLTQVLRGDFGVSYSSGERVWVIFWANLGETAMLTVTSLAFGLTGAFLLAGAAARYPGSPVDRAAVIVASVGAAMPGYWLALLLILGFSVHLNWLPAYGTGTAAHLVLPALTLALWVMASQTRLLRSFFLDARAQPFMETLRLRGHTEGELFFRHTLRHALAPALTMIGLDFASLLEGAIIIELTFARSGIGSLFASSVLSRDLPVVMFLVMFFAVTYVTVNTLVEIVQRLSDPRARYGDRAMTPVLVRFFRRTLIALSVLLAAAAAGLWLSPYDPDAADFLNRLSPPSAAHWAGTDHLGRDIATRLLHGGLWSLGLSLAIASFGLITGTLIGIAAAQSGRLGDFALMRLTDSFFAFPELVAAVAVAGIFGPSTLNLVIALALVSWMKFTRLARSLATTTAAQDFVTQARLNGLSKSRILLLHILPNILPSILVLGTNSWSRTILAVSGLSFLGFGVQPPQAEWGAMLLDGKPYMQSAPHLMIFPGLAVLISVLLINLTGDRLRDLLAPQTT